MVQAARRSLLGLAAVVGLSSGLPGAESARSAPTRPPAAAAPRPAATRAPATIPAKNPSNTAKPVPKRQTRIVSTMPLDEAAAKLGLKLTTDKAGRAIALADDTRKLELELDSREARFDGIRLFLGEPIMVRKEKLHVSRTDYETCLIPLLRPRLAATRAPVPEVIVIDPGHGGADTGAQNPKLALLEKTVTLDVALRLKKLLERRDYKVVLTRSADERLELAERALIANRAKADLFVSIHFNSLHPDTKTSGAEVFTFTRAGQRSDQSRGFGQDDDTEDDAAPVNRFDPWSVALAQAVHREIVTELKLPDRGHKTKHLGMLRALKCPAALVEAGFLSNEQEARKIGTAAYRQDIAEALASGIERYASMLRSVPRK